MAADKHSSGSDDGTAADERFGWLRPGPHLLGGFAVLLLGLYLSIGTAQLERERQLSERQADVQRELAGFNGHLAQEIYAAVALARGLAVLVVQQEGITHADFQSIARELRYKQPQIIHFSIAPGFVVGSVHPLEANEGEIGSRLLDDPRHKEAMLRAIRLDEPVLAGPYERPGGGHALAVWIPMWVDKDKVPRLWGAVGVVLDHEMILRRSELPRLQQDLDVSIVGRDASGPGGEVFHGQRPARDDNAVRAPVMLPGGSWLVSAVPRGGWYRQPWWIGPGFLFRIAISLLAALATARILGDRHRIRRLASRDELTNLPNRRWAMQRLSRLLQRQRRGTGGFALLSFDLDGFKPVNDTYGHAAGDYLLAEIGRRMVNVLRPADDVARMGGDEFLVLVPTDDGTGEDWLLAVATRVQAAISRPVQIEGHWVVVGASIGIARYPEDGDQAETLLRKADAAMYRAKQAHLAGIEFASPPASREPVPMD